jgi:hypothetical protein
MAIKFHLIKPFVFQILWLVPKAFIFFRINNLGYAEWIFGGKIDTWIQAKLHNFF